MIEELDDARKLGHGTYADVIVVEHRKRAYASPTGTAEQLQQEMSAPHVVLELPAGMRVIDRGAQYEIDGVAGTVAPTVGVSYRLIVEPSRADAGSSDAASGSTLRYETMSR